MRFTATISIATCALAVVANCSLLGDLLGNINLQINACPQIYLDSSGSTGAKGRPVFQSSNPACPNYVSPEQLVAVGPASAPGIGNPEAPASKSSALSSVQGDGSGQITMLGPMSTAASNAPGVAKPTMGPRSSSSLKGMQSSAPATRSTTVRETASPQTRPIMSAKPTNVSDGRANPAYNASNSQWPRTSVAGSKAPAPAPAPAPGPVSSLGSLPTSKGCVSSLSKPATVTTKAIPSVPIYSKVAAPSPFRGANTNDFAFPAAPVPDLKPFVAQMNTVVSVDIPGWPMGVAMETRNVGVFEFSS